MSTPATSSAAATTLNRRQHLFMRYFTAILVDLAVLNLFDEYWALVQIESFTISLFTAVVLQVLLQATLVVEHKIANYFKAQEGTAAKVKRILASWFVLFASKFVILGAINQLFGDEVVFTGPAHGVVAFIVVVFAIIIAEQAIIRLHRALGSTSGRPL